MLQGNGDAGRRDREGAKSGATPEREHLSLADEIDDLRRENERLRAERDLLVAHAHDGFWDRQLDRDYEYLSPSFWVMLGVDPDSKRRASPWRAAVHPEDLPGLSRAFDRHVASGGEVPYDEVAKFRHDDGHWVHVRCRGQVVEWNDDGSPRRVVGTHTDVTQWVETRTRAEILYGGASVGIWDWLDVNADKEFWSPRFYELLGYEFEEIAPSLSRFRELLHPDDVERTFAAVTLHLDDCRPFDIEYRLRHKSGEFRWFHGLGEALRDSEGRALRMVGAIEDIHARKVAEGALANTNAELEQFVYFASHDLQAPLRHIRAFVDLLEQELADSLDGEKREWMQFVTEGAERMSRLIRDLLEYSRSGKADVARDELALDELVAEVATMFEAGQGGRPVTFELGELPVVVANRTQLGLVLQNLFENASRHGREGVPPRVKVWADSTPAAWTIHVADNGIGVASDDQARIFEPFVKGATATHQGSGIGLAICRRIARRHGGDINVTSSPDAGATFHVTIARQDTP